MLYITTNDGEATLRLTNVTADDAQWEAMLGEALSDDEADIVGDMAFEGHIIADEAEALAYGEARDCTFEEYIAELKQYCVDIMQDSE